MKITKNQRVFGKSLEGLEPTTLGLRIRCSTLELQTQKKVPTGNRTQVHSLEGRDATSTP